VDRLPERVGRLGGEVDQGPAAGDWRQHRRGPPLEGGLDHVDGIVDRHDRAAEIDPAGDGEAVRLAERKGAGGDWSRRRTLPGSSLTSMRQSPAGSSRPVRAPPDRAQVQPDTAAARDQRLQVDPPRARDRRLQADPPRARTPYRACYN
jgi:hypothetical protein